MTIEQIIPLAVAGVMALFAVILGLAALYTRGS